MYSFVWSYYAIFSSLFAKLQQQCCLHYIMCSVFVCVCVCSVCVCGVCAGVPTGYIPGPGAIQGRGRANKVSKISNLIASLQSTNSQTCLHYFPVYTTNPYTHISLFSPYVCVEHFSVFSPPEGTCNTPMWAECWGW